jgi:hypothetical protein
MLSFGVIIYFMLSFNVILFLLSFPPFFLFPENVTHSILASMKDKRQRKRGLETRRKKDINCGIEPQKWNTRLRGRKKEDWRQGTEDERQGTEDGRQGTET